MFRVSLRPSSGEQTACHILWFSVLPVAVVVPDIRVARCVHYEEDVLSGTTTATNRTENHRQ